MHKSPNPTLSSGTKLGRYEIRSQLGAGGMGEVYLAFDTELDRSVALKILPRDLASDQERLQRFVQEAKSVSALNHPHILTIFEIGQTDNVNFIATEFIDGETLRQRMANGPLKLTDVVEIATQVNRLSYLQINRPKYRRHQRILTKTGSASIKRPGLNNYG